VFYLPISIRNERFIGRYENVIYPDYAAMIPLTRNAPQHPDVLQTRHYYTRLQKADGQVNRITKRMGSRRAFSTA